MQNSNFTRYYFSDLRMDLLKTADNLPIQYQWPLFFLLDEHHHRPKHKPCVQHPEWTHRPEPSPPDYKIKFSNKGKARTVDNIRQLAWPFLMLHDTTSVLSGFIPVSRAKMSMPWTSHLSWHDDFIVSAIEMFRPRDTNKTPDVSCLFFIEEISWLLQEQATE